MRREIRIVLFHFVVALLIAPNEIRAELKRSIEKRAQAAEKSLLSLDCPFLLLYFDRNDDRRAQLGLCIHTQSEERGIYKQTACVGALVEPDSKIANPFYGSKGNWGIEGACTRELILKKLSAQDLESTVNPITDLRAKKKEGYEVRLLRDEFKIWDTVSKLLDGPAR